MARPTALEFDADFPDDCLWGDCGEELLRPEGLALSEAISSLLRQANMQVSQPEMDVDHYCWYLDVGWLGKHFQLQVVQLNTSLVVVSLRLSLPTFLKFGQGPSCADLAECIAGLLCNDPRFVDLRLYDTSKSTRLPYRPAY